MKDFGLGSFRRTNQLEMSGKAAHDGAGVPETLKHLFTALKLM